MTRFLSVEHVIAIHDFQIVEYGGATGLRDVRLLEAAVYHPQSGYYETEIEMAAALWESQAPSLRGA